MAATATGGSIRPLIDEAALARRVEALADEMAARLPVEVTMLVLLKGAFVFAADLLRALARRGLRPRVEFLRLASYGHGTVSRGRVEVIGGVPANLAGRDVLVVDDIQDTGRTLACVLALLREAGVRRVWTCALLDKPSRREVEVPLDFRGFTVPDVFVVGYGIDCAERWRELPWIGHLADVDSGGAPVRGVEGTPAAEE